MVAILTTKDALSDAERILTDAGVEAPGLEAERLACHALGTNRAGLYAGLNYELGKAALETFLNYIKRRAEREPLQYITGSEEFCGLTILVTPDVLIPRPETEVLVEAGTGLLKDNPGALIADIGTGSGCIAVSLAVGLKTATVYAVDSSAAALKLAERNAQANGLSGRVAFLEGDLFAPLEDKGLAGLLDLIVTNPPYIPGGELPGLQPEVLFEPLSALDGGPDGLDAIRRIIGDAPRYLKPGGTLLMEIGHDQSGLVRALVDNAPGFEFIEFTKDFAGIERVLVARRII